MNSIYVDSMIDQRRTAGLNRELEHRRIAVERGTLTPARRGIAKRVAAVFAHRTPRQNRPHAAAEHAVRHA